MLVDISRSDMLPIGLDDAKGELRVSFNDDDASIEGLILSEARRYEIFTRRVILRAMYHRLMPGWCRRVPIRLHPVREITGISYTGENGEHHDLPDGGWRVSPLSGGGVMVILLADPLPRLADIEWPVRIVVEAGCDLPGEGSSIAPLDHADRTNIMHLVKRIYDHDDPLSEEDMRRKFPGRRLLW